MKKSLICLGAVAAATLSVVGLTSCKDGDDKGSVDVNIHYMNGNDHMGVTYRSDTSATGLGGETLTQGKLLPSWVEIGKNLGLSIRDAANYSAADVKSEWESYIQNGFNTPEGRKIDLMMADGNQSAIAADSNLMYSIDELMDKGLLPNFKKWLDTKGGGKSGGNWSSMKSKDGKVYYTPYFAGEYGTVEKNFMMNVDMVKWLLDDNVDSLERKPKAAAYDTTAAKTSAFVAQVPSMDKEKISVSNKGKKETIEVSFAKSIVTIQNELEVKNGATYTNALKKYIDDTYGNYIGANKLYKTRSEIFTSEAACYNADELVALMRCAANNPKYLTGTETVVAMAPRSVAANRQVQILQLASIWGLKGLAGEKERLYYDKDGKLQDARTKESTYEALDKLHELYLEGFFPGDYYKGYNGTDTSSDSFRKIHMKAGQLFMMYDFNAGTTAFNNDADSTSKTYDFEAVMPPVAEWDDGEGTGENRYFHYTEDILALKSGGYCIPKSTDNLEAACKIMDYTWCDEGADLQDYGPNTTAYRNAVTTYDANGKRVADNYDATSNPDGGTLSLGGSAFCVLWAKNVTDNAGFKAGWNDFCRKMIGSTQGVGHQRSAGLDIQTTISLVGRAGFAKLTSAVSAGVLRTAGEAGSGIFQSVPSNFALNSSDNTAINNNIACQKMTTFWKESKSVTTIYSYWICGGKESKSVKDVITDYESFKGTFAEIEGIYIVAYRKVLANA